MENKSFEQMSPDERQFEYFNLMYEIVTDLNNALHSLDYLFEVLFGGNKPSTTDYQTDYYRFQAIFAMATSALHKFTKGYELLMGEGEDSAFSYETDLMNKLHSVDKWWRIPKGRVKT